MKARRSRRMLIARSFAHDDLKMAHVIAHQPHQVSFPHRPVNHAPSPLGFGFGLSTQLMATNWPTPPLQRSASSMPSTASYGLQSRVMKRRYEHDEEDESHKQAADDAMERSPTPERPKRAAPKRARTIPSTGSALKESGTSQEQSSSSSDGNDVDVGVLLGMSDASFSCTCF
jgi:hypothetical protein